MSNFLIISRRLGDDRFSTQRAIQTVAAGQQAENLLCVSLLLYISNIIHTHCSDFDDAPAGDGQPSGLAATEVLSQPAAANLLAGTSNNPLDDLVSIFGSGGGSGGLSLGPPAGFAFGNGVGLGFGSGALSPAPPTATSLASPMVGRVSDFGAVPQQKQQPQQAQDDLLGLF
jgi:hypothetical protein